MEQKDEINLRLVERLSDQPLLAAYVEINHLKQLYRQGWLGVGISREDCESVADHCFGMVMLAWLVVDAGLAAGVDRDRMIRMVLVHELGEIYAGDLTPADGVPREEKQRLERDSVNCVTGRLPGGREWAALWEDFEEGVSAEAQLVRQLDRLEMALQALVYEKQGKNSLNSFYRVGRIVSDNPACALIY
jgi:putative hydrolase of HD superfamily